MKQLNPYIGTLDELYTLTIYLWKSSLYVSTFQLKYNFDLFIKMESFLVTIQLYLYEASTIF